MAQQAMITVPDGPLKSNVRSAINANQVASQSNFTELYDTLLPLKRDITDGKFGNVAGGHYIEIDTDGGYKAYGNARRKRIVSIDINGVALHPSQSPSWVNYKGSRVISFSGSAAQTIYFVAKMPYSYENGTDMDFEVHGVFPVTTTGTRIWELTHSWVNIGDACPTETLVQKTFSNVQTADIHAIGTVATLAGTGKTGGSVLMCSLTRRGDIDTESGVTYLTFADFIFIGDKFGQPLV